MAKDQNKIPKKTKNAAERLNALEQNLNNLAQNVNQVFNSNNERLGKQINILADELDRARQTIQNLGKRLNTMAELAGKSDELNKAMLDAAVLDLKGKVDELVELGAIALGEDQPITDKTFVVGREIDADGNEVNPRVQFATASMDKSLQDKLMGKKAGDIIEFEEGQPKFEITEVYLVQEVKKDFEEEASEEKSAEPTENTEEEAQAEQ